MNEPKQMTDAAWDKLESEHFEHHDPLAIICPKCKKEDSFIEAEEDKHYKAYCRFCGYVDED